MTGFMPPPGWRITTFVANYTADENRDGNGDLPRNISNFYFSAKAVTMRFQYVWPDVEWLGANVETRFGHALYTDLEFRADIQTPGGVIRRRGADSGTLPAGFVAPILLGWHGKTLHQTVGPIYSYPTRRFEKTKVSNITTGFSSLSAFYGVTWLPDDKWELSSGMFYVLNRTNPETNYRSGRELSIDVGAGYFVNPAWQIGASGYLYKQVSDDSVNGVAVAGGNRGQVMALGPFIRYRPSKTFGVTLKWQPEFNAENRPIGNRLYLQFLHVL